VKSLLRWLSILPASFAAWYLALAAGIALHGTLLRFCPPDQLVSGWCAAPWYRFASQAVVCIGAGLAAALILVTSTWLAPAHKRLVAIAAYLVGAAVACTMGFAATAYAAMACALLVGAGTLALILRRLARDGANDSVISRS
jgi:hypothetical protein